MSPHPEVSHLDLTLLRQRLLQVNRSWAMEDYRAFVNFYAKILPTIMHVERCTIFIMEIGSKRICSLFGTGLNESQIEPPVEGSMVGRVITSGESLIDNNLSSRYGFHVHTAEQTGFVCENMLCSPIRGVGGQTVRGAVQLINKLGQGGFTDADRQTLEEVAHFLSLSIESIALNTEILRIASALDNEVHRLEKDAGVGRFVIAESLAMQTVLEMVQVVSKTPINVLLLGENGTGKELIARMIHDKGQRQGPFVSVNCSCIPKSLVESEFFGHERGAFTGAESMRRGQFEESSGGTLFLDEVADMDLAIQPKFLRALEEQEGCRLGSNTPVSYDLRLISATNKDLAGAVQQGGFREDLYFRLFAVEIVIPPLRDRREDILPLSLYFLEQTNQRFNKQVAGFSREVLDLFERYTWPGNVRQLLREVERLVALTPDQEIAQVTSCSEKLLAYVQVADREVIPSLSIPDQVERLERGLIDKALKQAKGNKTKAAALLKLTRQGLAQKIKRYNLQNWL